MKSTLGFLEKKGLSIVPNEETTDIVEKKTYYILTDKQNENNINNI